MIHRLIYSADGWTYVPFAESRMNAMKMAGIEYGSQSFFVDGFTIKISVTPEHDYVEISGGVTMLMDSGVVDLRPLLTLPYDNCKLYSNATNTAYNTGFTQVVPKTNPITQVTSNWTKNPSGFSQGQLSGDVTRSATFKGFVSPDAQDAASFSAKYLPNGSSGWVRAEDDEALLTKRAIATTCPASIFTGKCRLYVQAMYGLPLYKKNKADAEGNAKLNTQPFVVHPTETGASPYLRVPLGDKNTGVTINVTTNTGVFLDPATRKHWLINFEGDGKSITLHPLVGKNESLRALLRPTLPDAKDPLTDTDKEHLEAYILATCLPRDEGKINIPVSDLPAPLSFGYGWHWDWTNGRADIVVIEANIHNEGVSWTGEIQGEYYTNNSTHYRLQLTPPVADASGNATPWKAELSTVEAKKEWNVYRNFWCLMEPYWAIGGFTKKTLPFSAIHAVIFNADVPIYAFYKRDELQVARLNIAISYPAGEVVERVPPGIDHYFGHTKSRNQYSTLGELGGHIEVKTAATNVDSGRVITVTFSCSGTSLTSYYNKNSLGYRTEISDKTLAGSHDTGTLLTVLIPTPYVEPVGYPSLTDSPAETQIYANATSAAGQADVYGVRVGMTYTITLSDVVEETHGTMVILAPRDDSQALFARNTNTTTITRSGREVQSWATALHAQWFKFVDPVWTGDPPVRTFPYTPDVGYSYKYVWGTSGSEAPNPTPISITNPTDEVITNVSGSEYLISASTAVIDFPDFYEAHDDTIEDIGAYTFRALSGTNTTTPTIFAPGRLAGITTTPAIVGWL